MDFLTPQLFDILIITNIMVGILLAGRKFYKDITGPLPDDAPRWMRENTNSPSSPASSSSSDS